MFFMWTIDELVERVGNALAEYPGAPNGRVRDVPDRRAVRWYATIGLVDRPGGARGRTALYEARHLLQLVAVKRLQAQGRTIAEIQAELSGASNAVLAGIARVPGHVLDDRDQKTPTDPPRTRFWASTREPVAPPEPQPAAPVLPSQPAPLTGIPLGAGAVLLVPGTPATDDYAALAEAARPLLEALAARGLLASSDPSADGSSS